MEEIEANHAKFILKMATETIQQKKKLIQVILDSWREARLENVCSGHDREHLASDHGRDWDTPCNILKLAVETTQQEKKFIQIILERSLL